MRLINHLAEVSNMYREGLSMDDLISRQALCEYALNQKDKSVTPNDIMRFPSAQSGWIPCSERLPSEDGNYLVVYESKYAKDHDLLPIGIEPFEEDCEGFGIWQERYDPHTFGCLGIDFIDIPVIAWYPLPEPYKPSC